MKTFFFFNLKEKLSVISRSMDLLITLNIYIHLAESTARRRLDTKRMNNLPRDFDVRLFPDVKRVYGLQQHHCMRSSRRGTRTRDAAGRLSSAVYAASGLSRVRRRGVCVLARRPIPLFLLLWTP